ncbi:MAG: methyltransferase domain-containing protein [Woeseiaceae bacterium]|nr:methyltransferase domain-containing protein [Woeseiaceae bacterium]
MDWNPNSYAENARYVSDLGKSVIDLLSPQAGERILDLGCGDGVLTSEISRYGCSVLGIDSSPEMVAAARRRGVEARVVDGRLLRFSDEFDAVFSNAALHWMSDPQGVIGGVWRALRPGGRFVGELGGYGNVSEIIAAIESAISSRGLAVACPWFFPRTEEYRQLLETAGFKVHDIDTFPRPTTLPGDVRGWLATFAHAYTSVVPENDRDELISEIVDSLRKTLVDAGGNWIADYVRLRFAATKP